jgi:hypothetical protein
MVTALVTPMEIVAPTQVELDTPAAMDVPAHLWVALGDLAEAAWVDSLAATAVAGTANTSKTAPSEPRTK